MAGKGKERGGTGKWEYDFSEPARYLLVCVLAGDRGQGAGDRGKGQEGRGTRHTEPHCITQTHTQTHTHRHTHTHTHTHTQIDR